MVNGKFAKQFIPQIFPDGHTRLDTKFPGFIRGSCYDCSAVGANNSNRFSPQLQICLLLDAGEISIHVKMKNDPVCHGISAAIPGAHLSV